MIHRIILIPLAIILFTGCAHPWIGRSVNTKYNPYWCQLAQSPGNCFIQTEHLKFTFTTTLVDPVLKEYLIKGYIEAVSIKSFSHFVTEKSTFYFALADNGIITDMVSFMLLSDNVQDKIPFELKFKSKPFNAVSVWYEFYVIG